MSVVIETTLGDLVVDLYTEDRPRVCLNFLKLCKVKHYNLSLFNSVQHNFIAQAGNASGNQSGGESIFGMLYGDQARYFEAEMLPKKRHNKLGTLSMVNCGNNMIGSDFFVTLGSDLDSLDDVHCVFGEVAEGEEVLLKLNEAICDEKHCPYQDIRITHTVVLEDPYKDPPGLNIPGSSPPVTDEILNSGRIAADEEIDDYKGKTTEEVEEMIQAKEAGARATILEMIGDLPEADVAPPENVLFVCKLNPVTTDDDLEIIFGRFGKIVSCEVIRDRKTGDSLQYAFIEFDNPKSCEDAYFKMDNVLIDDRRIHVDFSQSVSKIKWKGKGRGVIHTGKEGDVEADRERSDRRAGDSRRDHHQGNSRQRGRTDRVEERQERDRTKMENSKYDISGASRGYGRREQQDRDKPMKESVVKQAEDQGNDEIDVKKLDLDKLKRLLTGTKDSESSSEGSDSSSEESPPQKKKKAKKRKKAKSKDKTKREESGSSSDSEEDRKKKKKKKRKKKNDSDDSKTKESKKKKESRDSDTSSESDTERKKKKKKKKKKHKRASGDTKVSKKRKARGTDEDESSDDSDEEKRKKKKKRDKHVDSSKEDIVDERVKRGRCSPDDLERNRRGVEREEHSSRDRGVKEEERKQSTSGRKHSPDERRDNRDERRHGEGSKSIESNLSVKRDRCGSGDRTGDRESAVKRGSRETRLRSGSEEGENERDSRRRQERSESGGRRSSTEERRTRDRMYADGRNDRDSNRDRYREREERSHWRSENKTRNSDVNGGRQRQGSNRRR